MFRGVSLIWEIPVQRVFTTILTLTTRSQDVFASDTHQIYRRVGSTFLIRSATQRVRHLFLS